jgi:hypothetical protein
MLGSNFDPFNQQKPRPRTGRPVAGRPVDDPDKAAAKDKRRKVLRYMFNPEIGQDFRNFNESHTYFVRFIANLFLQTGLVDASYPGFADREQMKLITLIEAAYRNLEFTREGMPRVLLFAAFVGSFVSVALAIVLFVLSLINTPAPVPPPARGG